MMANIKRDGKKYSINTEFCFDDLANSLPLEAETAKEDMIKWYQDAIFTVREGDLYANHKLGDIRYWYFFDTSTRHWSECDDPVTA